MSADQLDKLFLLIKALEKKVDKQHKIIEELQNENKIIIENTDKMGTHIDFINGVYEKLRKSYLLRNIFS